MPDDQQQLDPANGKKAGKTSLLRAWGGPVHDPGSAPTNPLCPIPPTTPASEQTRADEGVKTCPEPGKIIFFDLSEKWLLIAPESANYAQTPGGDVGFDDRVNGLLKCRLSLAQRRKFESDLLGTFGGAK